MIHLQMAELKGQLAAAHAELQANAAAVAEAASAQSQVDWLHARLQSSLEEVQVCTCSPTVRSFWLDCAYQIDRLCGPEQAALRSQNPNLPNSPRVASGPHTDPLSMPAPFPMCSLRAHCRWRHAQVVYEVRSGW